MKKLKTIFYTLSIGFFLLFSCKQSKKAVNHEVDAVDVNQHKFDEKEVVKTKDVKKEMNSVFITMERTPCFGTCPSYFITIYNSGKVMYIGRKYAKFEGKYTGQLSTNDMEKLKTEMTELNIFELKDIYDAQMTDVPSCIVTVNIDGRTKKIVDRVEGPAKLKAFEKLIDSLVITDSLKNQ